MLLGNIFISCKLFQITTQQRGGQSPVARWNCITCHFASRMPVTDWAFSPSLQSESCQSKADDSLVPKVRHNFWEYFVLKIQERRSCIQSPFNFFFFSYLSLPKLRNSIKVKIEESKFCSQLLAFFLCQSSWWWLIRDSGSEDAQLLLSCKLLNIFLKGILEGGRE